MVHNPFNDVPISGTWEEHAGYSLGGTDLPLGYGTPIPAPAAGTLRITGGSGESRAGLVGSAGRRAILKLDSRIPRIGVNWQTSNDRDPWRRINPEEGQGPLDSIVLQHLSAFAVPKHYEEGEIIGWSGNSIINNDGSIGSAQTHLHWHGLNLYDDRLRLESFIGYGTTAPAGGATTPINNESETDVSQLYTFRDEAVRVVDAATPRRLSNSAGAPQNVVGGEGNYTFATHVEGTGLIAGDRADLSLIWHDVEKGTESRHFIETIHGSDVENGIFKRNPSFVWPVKAGPQGTTVVLELRAVTGAFTVTLMACNSLRTNIQ